MFCTACPDAPFMRLSTTEMMIATPAVRPGCTLIRHLLVPVTSRVLGIANETQYDPSLAPPGKHILGVFLQYAPYTLREGNWDDLRLPFAKE